MDCSKVAGDTSKNPFWGLGPNPMEKDGLANTRSSVLDNLIFSSEPQREKRNYVFGAHIT